jgi:hypothetical protein
MPRQHGHRVIVGPANGLNHIVDVMPAHTAGEQPGPNRPTSAGRRVTVSAGRGAARDAKEMCVPDYHQPQPGVVQLTGVREIAPDLVVVPNRHADLVPNIGVIGGTHSVLVVETGMGATWWRPASSRCSPGPPYDTDVSGLGWIAVMHRLIDEHMRPRDEQP